MLKYDIFVLVVKHRTNQNQSQPSKTTHNYPRNPIAIQNQSQKPKITHNHPKPVTTTQNYPKPPKPTQKYRDPESVMNIMTQKKSDQ